MLAMKENKGLGEVSRDLGALQFRQKFKFGHEDELNPQAGDISGKVKYNPAMAQTALNGKFLDSMVLKTMIKQGEINTVNFTTNNVMLKPVYRVLTTMNQVEGKKDTYYFHLWTGKKDGGKPDSLFSKKIYVCTNPKDPSIDNKTTYSIEKFIHHKMSEDEAYTYNHSSKEGQEFVGDSAIAGDPVILLGMHVSTRETKRWTWQSFYWTENPDAPVFPSSSVMAAGRNKLNKKLESPADHYAVTIGYSMMSPALPYDGGPIDIAAKGVTPVYALNPYIEGTFTEKEVFPNQLSDYYKNWGADGNYKKQFYIGNNDGITSNCMSCHSQAYYNNQMLDAAVGGFLADQYVNRDAPWFKGSVQLDFAWSLFPGFEPPPSKVDQP